MLAAFSLPAEVAKTTLLSAKFLGDVHHIRMVRAVICGHGMEASTVYTHGTPFVASSRNGGQMLGSRTPRHHVYSCFSNNLPGT